MPRIDYLAEKMKRFLLLTICAIAAILTAAQLRADTINTRVIQPPYAPDAAGIQASFDWMMNRLAECGPELDLIVLPEFSDVPGRTKTREEYLDAVNVNNARLLEACAATAARCKATLFVNAIDFTGKGIRNTTFAYDKTGRCVGKYYKRHVTAGERDDLGFDVSYAREWSEPYILEIDGIRYAFLTCYDFYFYEMIGPIAQKHPDIVIGCSLQRSDKHHALEFINQFCAYNTGAYLVRASVSMGQDATVGGSSMVVAPTGIILGNMRSRTGALDISFDPSEKYLKPAGFGNPPATHPSYMEIGRRPWLYRPGGSAICLPIGEAPAKRICACGGMKKLIRRSPLAAIGAAVALDVPEIGLDLKVSPSGVIEYRNCTFESVLRKFSCHTLMSLNLTGEGWDEAAICRLMSLIRAFDAVNYVYFCSSDTSTLDALKAEAPGIPTCFVGSVKDALDESCPMVLLVKADADEITKAHEAGLRCIVRGSSRKAGKLMDMGADTVIIEDFK